MIISPQHFSLRPKVVVITILMIFLISWACYLLFGHNLIKAIYEGKATGLLNGIIKGQAEYPLSHYIKNADELFFSLVIFGITAITSFAAYGIMDIKNIKGIAILRIGIITGVIIICALMFFCGYENTWRLWHIPVMSPCFADFRSIPGGLASQYLGYDPLINNPGDPWGRPMNYPRVWLIILAGINQHYVVFFGILFAVLFILSIFIYMPSTISRITALVLLVSIFSPAVLLGMERGNTDLLMFCFLSVAILYMSKDSILANAVGMASLLIAFILKLFPIFGIGLIFGRKKQVVIKIGLLVLFVVIIYAIAINRDLALIKKGTPQSPNISYGIAVLWMKAQHDVILGKTLKALSYIAAIFCFVVIPCCACNKKFSNIVDDEDDPRRIAAFRVGSGIYAGTFLLGANFDYRLVFLLFTIPQLMLWIRSASAEISIISKLLIAGIIFSLWQLIIPSLSLLGRVVYWLDGLTKYGIFTGLLFLFFCSLPAWMKCHMNIVALPNRNHH